MNIPGKWLNSLKSSAAIGASIIFIVSSFITLSVAALAAPPQSARVLEAVAAAYLRMGKWYSFDPTKSIALKYFYKISAALSIQ